MIANFLEYFLSENYDNKIIIKNAHQNYSVKDLKNLVFGAMQKLQAVNNEHIVLNTSDNLNFIVNFFACIFCRKNIYLSNNIKRHFGYIENPFIIEDTDIIPKEYGRFDSIVPQNTTINFYTSGSTSKAKCIKKTLQNLIDESEDLYKEFKFQEELEFISTTTLNHLFGMTFQFMLPINKGFIINVDRINYPEEIRGENYILISTPSFLEKMAKYDVLPPQKLKYIITAGDKLKDEIFKYAKNISQSVIEIYGSTETGIIAYRMTFEKPDFKLFDGIKITCAMPNETQIITRYSDAPTQNLGDKIEWDGNKNVKFLGRTDRILKIQEKRISAPELEEETEKHEFVNECYCFEYNNKIATIVALTQEGMQFAVKNGILALKKLLKSYLKEKFNVIPQRWKFIDEIPKTDNGKIDKISIMDLFNLNLSLPLIISRKIGVDCSEFRLFFYKNCNFFKGHFDRYPIVPGVVQLYYANYFTQIAFKKDCHTGQIRKIKFTNIIHADDIVDLLIEKQTKGMAYEYVKGDTIYSSGLLPHKNWFEGA